MGVSREPLGDLSDWEEVREAKVAAFLFSNSMVNAFVSGFCVSEAARTYQSYKPPNTRREERGNLGIS